MPSLSLRPWQMTDLPLLHRANTPEMTSHLGGPETEKQLTERHRRYLSYMETGEARMFVMVSDDHAVGSIGYWMTRWREQESLETGWFVVPEAQGRGFAAQALSLMIADARAHAGGRRTLVAFPRVTNRASNALCRGAGFELTGTVLETFRGTQLTLNEWMLDLAYPGGMTPATDAAR